MLIGYARVSSLDQSYTHALEQQCQRLWRYGVEDIIQDIESGKSDKRQGFNRLLELVEKKDDLTIVATRIDRLTRSLITLKTFFKTCEKHGVKVVVLDDNIDTETAAGKFNLNVLGALAEMESDRLSERIKHGHKHHQNRLAAYNPPFGYVKINDKLEFDRESILCCNGIEWSCYDLSRYRIDAILKQGSLRKALQSYNEYFGIDAKNKIKAIGNKNRQLYISVSGFSTWLSNPALRGHLAYGRSGNNKFSQQSSWNYNYNVHDALMSEEEWLIINDILQNNVKRYRKLNDHGNTAKRPFASLLRCVECKRNLAARSYKSNGEKRYSYRCLSKFKLAGCTQVSSITERKVKNYVINLLREKADVIVEKLNVKQNVANPKVLRLREQIEQLKMIPNASEPIVKAIVDLQCEIDKLQSVEKIDDMLSNKNHQELVRVFGDYVFWSEYVEPFMSPTELRTFYKRFIETLWVDKGEIVGVTWRI